MLPCERGALNDRYRPWLKGRSNVPSKRVTVIQELKRVYIDKTGQRKLVRYNAPSETNELETRTWVETRSLRRTPTSYAKILSNKESSINSYVHTTVRPPRP